MQTDADWADFVLDMIGAGFCYTEIKGMDPEEVTHWAESIARRKTRVLTSTPNITFGPADSAIQHLWHKFKGLGPMIVPTPGVPPMLPADPYRYDPITCVSQHLIADPAKPIA